MLGQPAFEDLFRLRRQAMTASLAVVVPLASGVGQGGLRRRSGHLAQQLFLPLPCAKNAVQIDRPIFWWADRQEGMSFAEGVTWASEGFQFCGGLRLSDSRLWSTVHDHARKK